MSLPVISMREMAGVRAALFSSTIGLKAQSTSSMVRRRICHTARLQLPQSETHFASSPSMSSQANSLATGPNPASRPFARHRPDLPQPKSYRLPMTLLVLFSAITWSAFTAHATNRERLSSSVLKNIVDKIRDSPEVCQAMGDDVHLRRESWLAGDPWIRGSVNMMQGRIDMSFKIVGSKDTGTVYFSAIRRDAQTPYETLRFLIVLDSNKKAISLLES